MKVALALVGTLVIVAAGAGARPAAACSRAWSPLEDDALGAAVADLIVVVDAREVAGGQAIGEVVEVLKGAAKTGERLVVIGPRSSAEAPMNRFCGIASMEVGQRYILLLWAATRPGGALHPIDPTGGVREATPEARAAIVGALARAHPVSAWAGSGAVLTRLALGPRPAAGEVDLIVVARNVSDAPLTWSYTSWPRATQSRCALEVVDLTTREIVAARPVPIPEAEITRWFTAHGPRWTTEVAPGAAMLLTLDRVTTAAMGWGHKERLGFVHYPARPGPHRIVATCARFTTAGETWVTAPLVVDVPR